MANGDIICGEFDTGTSVLASGSAAVLLSYAVATSTTVQVTIGCVYQRTTSNTDRGWYTIVGLARRAGGSCSITTQAAPSSLALMWTQPAPVLAASGGVIKVTVSATTGETRFIGEMRGLSVKQSVLAS